MERGAYHPDPREACASPRARPAIPAPRGQCHGHRRTRHDEERAVSKPLNQRGDAPPSVRPAHFLQRVVVGCFNGPGRERDEEQRAARIGRVMLQLQREKPQVIAEGAKKGKDGRTDRRQPSASDPPRRDERTDAEEHGHQAQRAFARAECEQRRPHETQPAEWRRLAEPQWTRELGEMPVADVERDHFLVEPERPRHAPEVEQQTCAGAGDDQCECPRPAPSRLAHSSPAGAPIPQAAAVTLTIACRVKRCHRRERNKVLILNYVEVLQGAAGIEDHY